MRRLRAPGAPLSVFELRSMTLEALDRLPPETREAAGSDHQPLWVEIRM